MQQFYLVVICLITLAEHLYALNQHFLPTMQLISGTLKQIESQPYDIMMVEEFQQYLLILSERLQQAERAISNEQKQLERNYGNYYEIHQLHFSEVAKELKRQANLNRRLTGDLLYYKNETQVAMRNEAKAVRKLQQCGIRGILNKYKNQMSEQVKDKFRHKIGKLPLLS